MILFVSGNNEKEKFVKSNMDIVNVLNVVQEHEEEKEMSMIELVTYHGYPIKHYFLETNDGYILDLYRIPGS